MHISLRRKLLLAILLAGTLGCTEQDNSSEVARFVESGRAYYESGQFNAALIEARSALEAAPDNVNAAVLLAEIHLELGLPRLAQELLEPLDSTEASYVEALVRAYLQRGKFASAITRLRRSDTAFQDSPAARHVLMGRARQGLNDLIVARGEYEQALELSPDNVEAKLGLISLDAITGRIQTAKQDVEALLAQDPDNVEALTAYAALLIRQSDIEQAEAALTRAIGALPTTDRFTGQRVRLIRIMIRLLAYQGRSGEALIYQEMLSSAFPEAGELRDKMTEVLESLESGEITTALALIEEIERISPSNDLTGTLRGTIAFLQGDDAAASELFARYVDPEIANSQTLELYAANQFRLDRPHRVLQLLEARAPNSSDPELLALYGLAAISAEQGEKGEKALRKALDLAPDRVRLAVVLADYYQQIEASEKAIEVLQEAHAENASDPVIAARLLRQYLVAEDIEAAQTLVKRQQEAQPEVPNGWILEGQLAAHLGNPDEALAALQQASEKAPDDPIVTIALGQRYLVSRQPEAAEAEFRKALESVPNLIAPYSGILASWVQRGDLEQGEKILLSFAEDSSSKAALVALASYHESTNSPEVAEEYLTRARDVADSERYWRATNARIYTGRARRALAEGDLEDARENIFVALRSFPANRELLGLLARVEIAAGEYTEARKVIEHLASVHPNARILHLRRGELAVAQQDFVDAKSSFETAWALAPGDELGMDLYLTYQTLGDRARATEFLAEWKSALPNSQVATVNEAVALADRGDLESAIGVYRSALSRAPDQPVVLNNLASLLLDAGEDPEALEFSRRAHELAGNSASIKDTYGWALYKNGRFDDAVRVLEQALELQNHPQIEAHLQQARDARNEK